ncbi:telomere length regulation protein TEL2 homolog isoform X2 [Gigantopelta aegis]|nr:telomere length regulation protein TEL2 homolog isoform X2 [Gigantopelta aegis]
MAIVSLPDNMANKLQEQNSEVFLPANYIPLIGRDFMQTLQYVHGMISNNTDCSLEFICRLFGKLCITGYGDILWDTILPGLYQHVQTDYIWCRICMRILTGLPDRCLESAILPLLNKIPWYGTVGKFVGDCVVDNPRVQYILCTKLLLHRFSEQVLLLQNVIGYLASSHTRRQLYLQVMKNLLQVWGDVSAVKHTSYEQHLYICRALIICISHLKNEDKQEIKGEFHRLLMPGIQCHIACADVKIRKQGMVVAEIITKALDATGPQLKFEYEHDAEVDALFSLLVVPKEPSGEEIEKRFGSLLIESETTREPLKPATEEINKKDSNKTSTAETPSDLDSDDDMEPFDMSHDLPVTKSKTPKYIRDCMEGLICSDDPDRVEACLKASEHLIRANRDAVREIAAELCKVLLHLSDNFAITNFLLLRFAALVAVTVQSPEESAVFLTNEFYERNYNLRQRMDILEVLAAAAQELSSPEKSDKVKASKPVEEIAPKCEVSNWREIVEKRIESKTRRFAKGPRQPPPHESANRFSCVAGYFFYPLMKHFDRKESTLDLLGEDLLILGRLVFTLGIILYAALHTPNCQRMGTTLLEFTWSLRFHTDPYIRQSVLFATSMIFLVVPCHFLLSDLQSEVTETKSWLQDVVEKDSNTECKKLAIQALVLLENSLKNEFDKGVSVT